MKDQTAINHAIASVNHADFLIHICFRKNHTERVFAETKWLPKNPRHYINATPRDSLPSRTGRKYLHVHGHCWSHFPFENYT